MALQSKNVGFSRRRRALEFSVKREAMEASNHG